MKKPHLDDCSGSKSRLPYDYRFAKDAHHITTDSTVRCALHSCPDTPLKFYAYVLYESADPAAERHSADENQVGSPFVEDGR